MQENWVLAFFILTVLNPLLQYPFLRLAKRPIDNEAWLRIFDQFSHKSAPIGH
jgi:hypothetical protein